MIFYYQSILVPNEKFDAWFNWMLSEHLPLIIQSGLTEAGSGTIKSVLASDAWSDEERKGMHSVEVGYIFSSKKNYDLYMAKHAPLRKEEYVAKDWGTKVKRTTTSLEVSRPAVA